MKDLYFSADLLSVLRDDKYYGARNNLSAALRKFGLPSLERTDNIEQMLHALVVHIMDRYGESEPFLVGTFIAPEAVRKLLGEHGLPVPAALQPAGAAQHKADSIDPGQFERYFDIVCRNCGTVTDPLARSYRTPIVRLIFRTFLETRRNLGINTTAKYVLEHLKDFDTEKIITSVNQDSVTWLADKSKEKLTSIETIAKLILKFNRELENLLRR
jgi:hypothetical protein